MYSFMDDFSSYNQINIAPADQHKTAFICPWGTFAYKKLPFGLKNAGATFQRAMSYAFHDIRHIVQPYLDDLPAHSAKRKDHPAHLREIFLRCRHYNIRLNPHKCVFCVELGRLLGFVVSQEGIRLDPLKVEAIVNLPPPATLQQLQSLQGKANFLRRFVPNYAEVAKGFTCLLKKDVPFHWDAVAQESFERLKGLLVSAPLLRPPNYHRDYILYLTAADTTICMVLVQTDNDDTEHVIYYLKDHIPDETLFLISTLDPWYGDILTYLQTSSFRPSTSKDARRRIRHQSQPYRIIGDTLYRLGADSVLRRCLTHEEDERFLNDCHSGACGGHMSGYATAQKVLRAGYFWPSIFKDCILAVRSCHECQIFQWKMWAPAAPLHPVVTVGPFAKWGIDYVTCNPRSAGGHGFIIIAIDYFTKWAEAMPTLNEDGHIAAQFLFNHVISRFGVPQAIVTDHGKHFQNHMMTELTTQLGLKHDSSTPYYPQSNGQVEAINKILVTLLQRTVGVHKSNWHLMLFPALWAH
eukprot:PITA_12667